jgi:Rad3-related DNA helicase
VEGLEFIEKYAFHKKQIWQGKTAPIPIVMNCPTAWGKTAVAGTAARWYAKQGLRVLIVTPQNAQIQQYTTIFPDFAQFIGKRNYQCEIHPELTAYDASAQEYCSECSQKEQCEYYVKFTEALESKIVVGNFHSFYCHRVSIDPDVILVDEWHRLPDFLKDLSTVTISEGLKGIDLNALTLTTVMRLVQGMKLDMLKKAESKGPKQQTRLALMCERKFYAIENMFKNDPENISFSVEDITKDQHGNALKRKKKGIVISPVNPNRLAINQFFSNAKSIILMSGTGFETDERKLKFFSPHRFIGQSPIDPRRRAIFVTPGHQLGYGKISDVTLVALCDDIRKIVKHHYPKRGIILCTYDLMNKLKLLLTEKYYVAHTSEKRSVLIDEFVNSREYMIPILAASYEGLDFKHQIAEFCIFPKIPFKSLATSSVLREKNLNIEQYIMDALTLIVQGSARVCRTDNDYGPTYLLDKASIRTIEENKHKLPLHFTSAVCYTESVDGALKFEEYIRKQLLKGGNHAH